MSSCTCGAKVGPAKISVPSFAYGDVAWKHHLDSAYTLDHSIPALALILQRRAAHSCALCVLSARACLYANWKLVCTIQEKKRGMRERERERERESSTHHDMSLCPSWPRTCNLFIAALHTASKVLWSCGCDELTTTTKFADVKQQCCDHECSSIGG